MQQNIILIGFMASGKSTVAKKLSKELDFFMLDTDEVIEKSAGEKISLIFKNKGEEHFRKIEKKLFKSIKKLNGFIIATGGGFCLKKVQKLGLVVWLDTPFKEILKRLDEKELSNRPKAKDDLKNLEKLYKKRKKIYKKSAHIRVKTKDKTQDEIINDIKTLIQNYKMPKNQTNEI